MEQQVAILTEALRLERHRQFGASSEKMSEDAMDQLSFQFNEAEGYNDVVKAEEPDLGSVNAVFYAFTGTREKCGGYGFSSFIYALWAAHAFAGRYGMQALLWGKAI